MTARSMSSPRSSRLRKTGPRPSCARLQFERLEDRQCPTGVFSAGFTPGTAILNITELSSLGNTSLTIS
jgi:hypothetical protein